MAAPKISTLDNGVYRLEHIGLPQLERTGDDESRYAFRIGGGEIDQLIAGHHSERIGISIHIVRDFAVYHAPCFRLQGIDIGVADGRIVNKNALPGVIVNHAASDKELTERKQRGVFERYALLLIGKLIEHADELVGGGKSDNEKRSRLLMLSDRQTVSEPLMSIMPRSVAKRTALSICVMLSGLMQTSRVMGCFAE